jgi:hypothetical protein
VALLVGGLFSSAVVLLLWYAFSTNQTASENCQDGNQQCTLWFSYIGCMVIFSAVLLLVRRRLVARFQIVDSISSRVLSVVLPLCCFHSCKIAQETRHVLHHEREAANGGGVQSSGARTVWPRGMPRGSPVQWQNGFRRP